MIRLFFMLLVACMLCASPGCSAPMDNQNTQQRVLQKLRARPDVATATLQQDGVISLLMKGETEARIVSTQQIQQLQQNSALPDSALDDFVAAVTASREAVEALPELSTARPAVRSKTTLDGFDEQLAKLAQPTALVRFPVVGDIEACFVFQTPHGMRYATQADLTALNMTDAAFADAAVRNFDTMTRETKWSKSDNALIAQLDGNYESSLLLVDNLWSEIEKALGGPIIVGVPARDSIIAVRADDAAQVAELRRAMNNTYAYPVSSRLLTRKNGRWVEFISAIDGE